MNKKKTDSEMHLWIAETFVIVFVLGLVLGVCIGKGGSIL